jgi:hypothetical protein
VLLLLLLVAPAPVRGDDVGSAPLFPAPTKTTTSSTISAEDAFLQPLLDDIAKAFTLPAEPIVLSGFAFPGRGRLKVRVWGIAPGEIPNAVFSKGRVRVDRRGVSTLKLHPTRFARRFGGLGGPFYVAMRYTTRTVDQRRTRQFYVHAPTGPVCCQFWLGQDPVCRGGLDSQTCASMSGFPFGVSSPCALGECSLSPGTPGPCCDHVPFEPGVCGAPTDESTCVGAGGTFHPASVCQQSGSCSP